MKYRFAIGAVALVVVSIGVIFFMLKWALSPDIDPGELKVMQAYRKEEAEKFHKATLVKAVKDIPEGELFSADNIQAVTVEPAQVPETAIWSVEDALGKQAAFSVAKGTPLVKRFIYVPKEPEKTGK